MNDMIRIVCDGKNGRFKHIEDEHLKHVDAGQWHEREDGEWEKRIKVKRIVLWDGKWGIG